MNYTLNNNKSIKSIKSTKSSKSSKSVKINNDKTKDNNEIKLTKGQKKVYDQLIDFVNNKIDNEILLVGYAGTGKTTLMAKFINDLVENKICKRIAMAAPTHKAVNIAKSKLFPDSDKDYSEILKTISIMTIHRLLNYQSYIGQEGEKFFARGKIDPNWSIYNLVVVDECSMLSNQIISDIKELISKEINIGVKVIYVGDPAQLPPVNQSDSKIFNGNIKKLELDKIIRTSNKMIMELSNSHRKWIFSKKDDDIPHVGEFESNDIHIYSTENKETKKWLDDFVKLLKENTKDKSTSKKNNKIKLDEIELENINDLDSGIDIIPKNLTNKVSELDSSNSNNSSNYCDSDIIIDDHIKMIDNHNNNIILTWTNKKSNMYNQYVRESIFNKKNLAQWEIGEILIFNDFYRTKNTNDDNLNNQEIITFYTSEQVKLVEIKQIKYNYELLKFKINNNITTELNDKFRKYYKRINQLIHNESFDIYEMKVQKIIDIIENKNEINIPEYTILSIHPNSEKKQNLIIEGIEKHIVELKSSCYKLINNSKVDNMKKCDLQSEVEKKINRLYKEYQSNIIECFAELNYGYCITVHKSQGSTFLNVFIDMNDILANNNINETSKCLYTSITRSSKTLKLLI